ncbi:MAG: ATP-binding protein [Solidesulfovibrio sp.]|uniref:ATP-binding protein n=1 Tax=Solidesulfovibrio sp. TaxID=2910990 RepID=UPI0031583A64
MRIAIASGKGGTGKTTVSAALASVWTEAVSRPVLAADLDVEEPNLHLFLRPVITEAHVANLEIPVIDAAACTRCGACREICQFGAVTILGDTPLVFDDMCHGCGACLAVCPVAAMSPGAREVGRVEEGAAGSIAFVNGRLRVGEAMSPVLIRAVTARVNGKLAALPESERPDVLLDAPPGVSCPAQNAVATADVIVLVVEPTPFGIHDFALAVEAFAPLGKPLTVVVNKAGEASPELDALCRRENLPVLAAIPDDRAIAEGYARGRLLPEMSPACRALCLDLARQLAALRPEARHA